MTFWVLMQSSFLKEDIRRNINKIKLLVMRIRFACFSWNEMAAVYKHSDTIDTPQSAHNIVIDVRIAVTPRWMQCKTKAA